MWSKILALTTITLLGPCAHAQITSLDLAHYRLTGKYALPPVAASEASAVTYNCDRDSLFVLGDEGQALAEVSRTGALISSMRLTGFQDTEGITYVGNGRFVLTEERLQRAYLLTYTAGGKVSRRSLQSVSLGPTVGNVGIEGISYEPLNGTFFAVKEKSPQAVYQATLDFPNGAASVTSLFTPALGVADLADIQVLSTVPSLVGTADQDNLLIISQESRRLLVVSRSGAVLSQFNFSALSDRAEGVTIDTSGTIFVVDEGPFLYVLSPVAVTAPP